MSWKFRLYGLVSAVILGILTFGKIPTHSTTDTARVVKYAQNDIVPAKGRPTNASEMAKRWFKSHTIGFHPIKQPPRFASSSPRFWVPQKNRAEKSEKACDAIGGALRPQRREWSGAATLCRHTTLTVMCRAFRQAMSREPSTLKE